MQSLMKQHFWIVRALGYSVAAGLVASALVTRVGAGYIFAPVDATEAAEGDSDGDEDDEDDSDAKSKSKKPKKPKKSSRSTIGEKRGRDQVNETILANNVFCPECVPLEPTEDAPVVDLGDGTSISGIQPGEKPSTLPLRLLATMESSDPQFSQATIRDEETGSVGPYWPGDNIQQGVLVMSVERGLVHLRNGAALEYLLVGEEPPKQSKKKPKTDTKKKKQDPSKKKGGVPGASDAIDCDSSGNQCTVEKAFVEKLLANPMALAKQARVRPSKDPPGFKFSRIKKDSLPRLLNLKNGDILTSVNGTDLKTMDQAMALYTKLRNASHLSVTIDRKGKTITKEIDIK